METKINELSKSEIEIEITYSYDEVKNDLEKEVKKQTQKIQIPGFRKGKVPIAMLKKMYGDALEYEAAEKVANTKFWEVAKEKELKPIGQPSLTDIKFNPNENLFFKVRYEVLPVIDVKDYTELEIEVPNFEVKKEDVEHEIEHIKKSNSTTEIAEKVGDDRNYVLKVTVQRVNEDGGSFEGSKPENLDIDLSNPGVQEEILDNSKGKKVGESFDFSFVDERTIKNEDGTEEPVSEKYVYKAEIKEIKKVSLPELNEELIKKSSKDKLSTEEELREQIKKDIQNYYDQRIDEITRDKILRLIVEKNDFTPPRSLVANILNDMVKKEEDHAKQHGMKSFDKSEVENRLRKLAELEVKWFLIKDVIQKKENISVSDDDLKEQAKKDSEKIGLPEDKLINYYKASNYGEKLVDQKLFEFLKEKNKIKKVDPDKFSKKDAEEINEK